jgi:hypothetical protein
LLMIMLEGKVTINGKPRLCSIHSSVLRICEESGALRKEYPLVPQSVRCCRYAASQFQFQVTLVNTVPPLVLDMEVWPSGTGRPVIQRALCEARDVGAGV